MATRNIAFGSGNGNKEIDVIDVVALILLPAAAFMIFGVFTFQMNVFGGFEFTAPPWPISDIHISLALFPVYNLLAGTVDSMDVTGVLETQFCSVGVAMADGRATGKPVTCHELNTDPDFPIWGPSTLPVLACYSQSFNSRLAHSRSLENSVTHGLAGA